MIEPKTQSSVRFPFNPAKIPIYYGWVILIVGSLGIFFSVPGQTMGVSVFTDFLIESLHLSRTRISTAYLVGTLLSALLLTQAGRLIDSLGVRFVSAIATGGLGLALLGLSQVDRIVALLGGPNLVIAFAVITLGFFSIRFCGQGVLALASRTMVMRWFEQRRGRVAAWFGIFTALGFSYTPRVFQYLIDTRSWRGAWIVLCLGLFVVGLPIILLFFRDSPERCGMTVEAGLPDLKINKNRKPEANHNLTLSQARHELRYWVYALYMAWWVMYGTAFTFHIVDIFSFQGFSATRAVQIFLPITIVAVGVNFIASWISDAIDLPPLFYAGVAAIALTSISMLLPGAGWSYYTLIIGYGISSGLWTVLSNITWPRLYGRKHLGEINGSVMAFIVAGSAIGPWIFSILRSDQNGYVMAGAFSLCGALILGILGIFTFRK